MAEGTLQILGLGTSAVPLDYQFSGSQTVAFVALKADFDGTSAMVDFVPVVEIISDAGHVMAQSKGPTVLAGGSATVTFFPFSSGGDSADLTGFIHFGANLGTTLDIETTTGSISMETDNGGGGFSVTTGTGAGNGISVVNGSGGNLDIESLHQDIRLVEHDNTKAIRLVTTGGGSVYVGPGLDIFLVPGGGGNVNATLPIVNPGGSGNLWNNAGVVNIT